MATRTTLTSGTGGAITGDDYMDNVSVHIIKFYNSSALRLTSIAGTADAVTAVVDPVLDTGLAAGMSFWFEAASNNTSTMTLKVGSETAVPIVQADGTAMASGDVLSTTAYLLYFDGTSMLVVSRAGASLDGATLDYHTFTGSGTLTKPSGFPNDGLVIMECWGGGGGGGSTSVDGGGGGGAYNRKDYRGSDLGATETVTIGAGGAVDTAGGNSSIGSLLLAFGGESGVGSGPGGGGGGQLSAGSGTTGGEPGGAAADNDGNSGGGGSVSTAGGDGIFGGGGGGGNSNPGGKSLYGGGGGAGDSGAVGGTSSFGGAGGDSTVGGTIPAGGGGGFGGAGARGEAMVRWIG